MRCSHVENRERPSNVPSLKNSLHEHFLREVLGVVARSGQVTAVHEHRGLVAAHEFGRCLRVAVGEASAARTSVSSGSMRGSSSRTAGVTEKSRAILSGIAPWREPGEVPGNLSRPAVPRHVTFRRHAGLKRCMAVAGRQRRRRPPSASHARLLTCARPASACFPERCVPCGTTLGPRPVWRKPPPGRRTVPLHRSGGVRSVHPGKQGDKRGTEGATVCGSARPRGRRRRGKITRPRASSGPARFRDCDESPSGPRTARARYRLHREAAHDPSDVRHVVAPLGMRASQRQLERAADTISRFGLDVSAYVPRTRRPRSAPPPKPRRRHRRNSPRTTSSARWWT